MLPTYVAPQKVTAVPRKETATSGIVTAAQKREKAASQKVTADDLIKRAKSCPVAWTANVTHEQLNPIIWSWAYIAELMASRSGQAPELPVGELEAKLQHFLNVMDITLQTSTKGDYMGDSWKVGRLYHNKVQAKIDQGKTSWCRILDRWENLTLPHELMAAQQELTASAFEVSSKDGKTLRCSTWNTWETEGFCQWECENAGQECSFIHECTYCKSRKFQPVDHQLILCQERIAARNY
jgi:hypothetical protein